MDKELFDNEIFFDDGELEEIIEIENEDGSITEYYLVGCMNYKGKDYAFFQPAEEIEGVSPDNVIAYEMLKDGNTLQEIEDQDLYDEIMQEYYLDYDAEYVGEDMQDLIN